MKKFETQSPLQIQSAQGSYITLTNDKQLIDAISSWWCKSLGHNHPQIKEALWAQVNQFEHVMLPNTTNPEIEKLSAHLSALMPYLNRVFYAGDGCCAIEIALKMTHHARKVKGQSHRNKFIALANSYHGDTCGAMSISNVDQFNTLYQDLTFDCYFIQNIPFVSGPEDPLWHDCSEIWPVIEKQLEPYRETGNAVVVEPLAQGAGGMNIYSADFLKRLSQWCRQNDVYLIADEIMTGMGRTGKMLACHHHPEIKPDFVCLSKGLTSGWLAMSAVVTHDEIFEQFYADKTAQAFLHSHTYSGNALAVKIANCVFQLMAEKQIGHYITETLGPCLYQNMQEIADQTQLLTNIRHLGGLVAADIKPEASDQIGLLPNLAYEQGLLLRPLGHTIYWAPPLNTDPYTLDKIKHKTLKALENMPVS
jgi:adenosylmethionine-8-amino-7-oxononanoate aminotransferase